MTALGEHLNRARLAVTPTQITRYNLPKSSPKDSDKRSFEEETTQAKSIPPDVPAGIIQTAIRARLDQAVYNAVLACEETIKAQFHRTLLPSLRRIQ
jgi:hypothetical protein